MLVALVTAAVAVVAACGQAAQPHLPQTATLRLSQGAITGVAQPAGYGRYFYSFKGIPYADPPVGNLRLRDPVRAGAWRGTRHASHHPPPCPQLHRTDVIGSEDCLYLNVYTPTPSSGKFPVMVYIHGGGFVRGGAADYPALPLLTMDVVLVVLQYRLGLLGFLSTEDWVLPGNLGLKDQTLALRWVQDNIRDLGGDPAQVTIFGDGSGAASVHYHILTPYSQGLFSRAILQSGSSLCPGALRTDHRRTAHQVALRFNCWDSEGTFDSWQLLRCLQIVQHHHLAAAHTAFHVWSDLPLVTVPRVDGDYLPHQPAVLLKSGRYNKVDLISGLAQHDGSIRTAPMYHHPRLLQQLQDQPSVTGPVALNFDEEESPGHLAGVSFHYYLGGLDHQGTSGHARADAFTQLFSERLFSVCHEDTALLHAATSPGNSLFLYELQHRGLSSHYDTLNLTVDDHWVSHLDTVQYLFDGGLDFPPLTRPDDLLLSHIMVQLWTSFATSGDPTPDASLGFRWSAASESFLHHLALTPTPAMHDDARAQVRAFWHSLPTRQNKLLFPDGVGFFRIISKEESAEEMTSKDNTTGFQPMDTTGKDQVAGSGDDKVAGSGGHQVNLAGNALKSSQVEAASGKDGGGQQQGDEGASSTLTMEDPEAATDKGDPEGTSNKRHPEAASDKGDPEAASDKGDPEAASDKGDPEAATDKGDPEAATDQGDPEAATDRGDPEVASDKGDLKAATDKGDPEAATDKGDPEAATDKGDPEAATDKGDPEAATDKGGPEAATDSTSTTAAARSVQKSIHTKAKKLLADYSVKKRKLDYGDIYELLKDSQKLRTTIDSGPPLLLSSSES